MANSIRLLLVIIILFCVNKLFAQKQDKLTRNVNVFLGTSGDHGQLSPAASYPFSMLSIGPQTYPNTHTGYEYKAKRFLGFTHNRIEGVGCMGSGGNLLIKPFIGHNPDSCELLKAKETGSPGYYSVSFKNGIRTAFTVNGKAGIEQYQFPIGKHGFFIDLSHALMNGFLMEQHQVNGNTISGWVESGTTCQVGAYKIYYYLTFDKPVKWCDSTAHTFTAFAGDGQADITIRIALSSLSVAYAKAAIKKKSFDKIKAESSQAWNDELNRVTVTGDPKEAKLFYSLRYRTLQSPYSTTEPDGAYRATDGSLQHTQGKTYNGWAIWDNYRTELPLLSIIEPDKYQDMVVSISNLYGFGKKNWATKTEPSNTVRTEHAMVVLLDAYRKGYKVNFKSIRDSLLKDADRLDFSHPDKALESSYDTWAMSQILGILKDDSLSNIYKQKAIQYKDYWNKDFKDISKPDVDQFGARKMYQGTIWQYRWFVPFDLNGLIDLCGGEARYIQQLDDFFGGDYYNAANEPDIQVPYMYCGTNQPWKSQVMIHKYAKDTVIQYYYDDNYRGIDPTIDHVFNNRPDAFIKSMDDDAGAMSAWYVLAACGISPACVGWPVYYLHVPLFKTITFRVPGNKTFTITVANYKENNKYIGSVSFNGKSLDRNWITQKEITNGGELTIKASPTPNIRFGINNRWITDISKN